MNDKRILVIGCPGSGKSTFSRRLRDITGLPLCHLDMLYWNEDGSHVSREVFLERLRPVLEGESWIIDGNYISSMELRLGCCDRVIFLDYSEELCLKGIRSRIGKKRDDIPWLELKEDKELVDSVKSFRREVRPLIVELLKKYSYVNQNVFENREQADTFLRFGL